jgi:hypothetical protein
MRNRRNNFFHHGRLKRRLGRLAAGSIDQPWVVLTRQIRHASGWRQPRIFKRRGADVRPLRGFFA